MARSVLVTGGNRGIGWQVAQAFVALGDDVAITYRSGEPPAGVFAVRADVTDPASLDAAFAAVEEHQGPVEVLVANAGITRDTLLLRMSDDDFDAVVQTNLVGSFRVAKRASKGMLRMRRGRLIFISSVVAMLGIGRADQLRSGQGRTDRLREVNRTGARSRGASQPTSWLRASWRPT